MEALPASVTPVVGTAAPPPPPPPLPEEMTPRGDPDVPPDVVDPVKISGGATMTLPGSDDVIWIQKREKARLSSSIIPSLPIYIALFASRRI